MTKQTLFISDLHLSDDRPQTATLFLDFLKTDAQRAEALYILGDLFRLWPGDDIRSAFTDKIAAAMLTCSKTVPIFLLPGNRDFLIGEAFAKSAGCTLIADPTKINLYGVPTLLTHGDILCTRDCKHRFFRAITRPNWLKKLFLTIPKKIRAHLAEHTHRITTFHKKLKSARSLEIQHHTIEKLITKYHVTQIIYGHTHEIRVDNFYVENQFIQRFVLDEWTDRGNCLIFREDKTFTMMTL